MRASPHRAAAGVLAAFLALTPWLGAEKPKQPAGASAAPPAKADVETCQACHEEVVKLFAAKRHSQQNCAACHAGFEKHQESAEPNDVTNPRELKPRASEDVCLSCHRNDRTHEGRIQSGHARGQTSCLACHSVHHDDQPKRAAAEINRQCSACHTAAWAEFQKPHRHPVTQGAMSCTSCHNPHGQPLSRVAKVQFNESGCFQCHGDKRGPFAFEHAPVRVEGCASCHEPHGSANPRMLTRPEVRQQCLECHSGIGAARDTAGGAPPAFHDLRSTRYRNCTVCHVKIHGSHVSKALLR